MKNSKGIASIIILIILLLLIGGAAYYFFGIKKVTFVIPTPVPSPVSSVAPSAGPTATPEKSTITSIDSTWNLYANNLFGYSIKVPKTSFEYGGVCSNGQLDVAKVPVTVFDNDKSAYITYEYFYEYPKNGACVKTQNSLSLVDQRANQWKTIKAGDEQPFVPGNWHIITASVANDSQLDQFIKDNWGTGCKLGAKTLNSTGIYDVKIEGDGLDLEVTKCPLNFVVALKYSSEFGKVATWGMGQAPTFSKVADSMSVYDTEMAASFKFTN